MRAVASEVEELRLVPQVSLTADGFVGTVDLADIDHRVVVEADSYAYHGDLESFGRDIDRYNDLVVRDWVVIRAKWSHLGTDADRFRGLLRAGALTARARKTGHRQTHRMSTTL